LKHLGRQSSEGRGGQKKGQRGGRGTNPHVKRFPKIELGFPWKSEIKKTRKSSGIGGRHGRKRARNTLGKIEPIASQTGEIKGLLRGNKRPRMRV